MLHIRSLPTTIKPEKEEVEDKTYALKPLVTILPNMVDKQSKILCDEPLPGTTIA